MSDSSNDPRLFLGAAYGFIVVVVFLSMWFFMEKVADGTGFEERLIANDLKLGADLILGFDGEVDLVYEINSDEHRFDSSFESPCVFSVVLDDTPIYSGNRISCVANSNIETVSLALGDYSKLVFEKTQDKFFVRGVVVGDAFYPGGGKSGGAGVSGKW
ncbi:hypothetical protein K8R33_03720 [archaeon]|nr:hypothetical protein [archaeon]